MDPVTSILTSYLFSISNGITENYRENVGLAITPVAIEYKGMNIQFQHQLWKIRDESVCASYTQDSSKYSHCTIFAKSLFKEICSELSSKNNSDPIYAKHQNMYCNAAIKYQPMIATISSPNKPKLSVEEKKCNQLILQAMNSKDKRLKEARDYACSK